MKMKISELSKMTGLSASGIRFYEEVGMIAPQRQKNGKYREYNLKELNLLMNSKNYQKYGFSLKDISELIYESDEDNIIRHFRSQRETVRQEIIEKQLLIDYIESQIEAIDFAHTNPDGCIMQKNPAFFWVKLWQPGSEIEGCLPEPQLNEWLDHLPIVESCLLFDAMDISQAEGTIESIWGLSIAEDHASKLDFSPQTRGAYLPARQCVYTTIESSDHMTIDSSQLIHVRKYLSEHGLKINGPAIARRIYNICDGDAFRRYDHLWMPVDAYPFC